MKRIATILLIICTLSSALCRAESSGITHNFNSLVSKGELTFPYRPSDSSVGVTDLVTYTGSGSPNKGGFGYSSAYCIILPKDGVIQTSPAISGLKRVQLMHTLGKAPEDVRIYISTDNSSWTEITSSAKFSSSDIDAPMPSRGDYYLKIVNENAATINFLSFQYTIEPCHCLRVVSE